MKTNEDNTVRNTESIDQRIDADYALCFVRHRVEFSGCLILMGRKRGMHP